MGFSALFPMGLGLQAGNGFLPDDPTVNELHHGTQGTRGAGGCRQGPTSQISPQIWKHQVAEGWLKGLEEEDPQYYVHPSLKGASLWVSIPRKAERHLRGPPLVGGTSRAPNLARLPALLLTSHPCHLFSLQSSPTCFTPSLPISVNSDPILPAVQDTDLASFLPLLSLTPYV
jgi:hypothetical protein